MRRIVFPLLLMLTISACKESGEKAATDEKGKAQLEANSNQIPTEGSEEKKNKMSEEQIDSLVADIQSKRREIEAAIADMERKEVSTEGMRASIRQKWSKIHIYSKEGEVVRIKTYPHDGISKRTEEFYFQHGNLILAVIEDNGEGAPGKSMEQIDKAYFFHNGEVIKEHNLSNEKEYSIRYSDGEQLLQEAIEYLSL